MDLVLLIGETSHGGNLHGTFPALALDDQTTRPTRDAGFRATSLDQYAATLASWFGVPASDLPTIFPDLGNFSKPVLSFLG